MKHLSKDKLKEFDNHHRDQDYYDYRNLAYLLKIKEEAHNNFGKWVKKQTKIKENVHIHSH